jgi:hypothetical protein
MMKLIRLGLFGIGCLLAAAIANSPELGAQQPKVDPEAAFRKADANGDGKVTREEWNKFVEAMPKLRDNPRAANLFNFLDANKDGSLSLAEFKKLFELGPKQKGAPAKVEAKKDVPADKPATADQIAFFEKNIRPVLVKECYSCHATTAEKVKGGLLLDTRDGLLKGGDTGPALVAGDPKKSLLIKALKHTSDELAMPPKKKLGDEVIVAFEKWIAMGAADPREGSAKVVKNEIDIEKGRKFWAFQPVKAQPAPTVKDAAWPKTTIDRFVLAGLEARGLKPAPDADAATLARRLYFDLIGLPPLPDEVDAFVADFKSTGQAAVAKVVDRLLASPAFGERWGRHWLDVVRFGESSGRAANFMYPHAWRYRDYVIAAFNADKPYDQFIREQLAGDLLTAKDDKQKAEFLIATGFLAVGPKSHNERSREQFLMDLADEQIDATFEAFQGLTVACARCHDHKFDPIPQKDYYALSGIFQSTETCYGTIRVIQSNHPSSLVTLPKGANAPSALEPLTAERRSAIERQIKETQDQLAKLGKDALLMSIFQRVRIATLSSQLTQYEADGTPKPLAMGARDRSFPADSKVYVRGEIDQPGPQVKRGFPQVLTTHQAAIQRGSGRKELAEWIASKDNPLTARVMANRVWLHLIGRGLVATPDNFGASGQAPSNPALLDQLALSFAKQGWSIKRLVRDIVLSRAYQLSSQFDESNHEADPDNVLNWRMPKRRLEAEAIRDAMLSISGRLDPTPPRGDATARAGEGNVGFFLRAGGLNGTGDTHRSVYLPIVRDLLPESLTLFDFPDPSLIVGERPTTTIPAQSLYLLNNPFVIREAEAVADKLLASEGDDADKLGRVYKLCFARSPTEKELQGAQKFIAEYGKKQSRRATWMALCQALFASAEFSYR